MNILQLLSEAKNATGTGDKAIRLEKGRFLLENSNIAGSVQFGSSASCETRANVSARATPTLLTSLNVEDNNVCDAPRKKHLDFVMASFIHGNGLPFGRVEDELFRNMIKELCPAYSAKGRARYVLLNF